jgi:hypothetical protein
MKTKIELKKELKKTDRKINNLFLKLIDGKNGDIEKKLILSRDRFHLIKWALESKEEDIFIMLSVVNQRIDYLKKLKKEKYKGKEELFKVEKFILPNGKVSESTNYEYLMMFNFRKKVLSSFLSKK